MSGEVRTMTDIVRVVSDHLNEGLRAAGYPPLTDTLDGRAGRIIIGNRHQFDDLVPPRIIMLPVAGAFSGRTSGLGPMARADNYPRLGAEARAAQQVPAIFGEAVTFECACWSIAPDDLEDSGTADFDYTRALYNQLIASFHALMPGAAIPGAGTWRWVRNAQRVGREFVFRIDLHLNVLSELIPTADAPYVAGRPPFAGTGRAPEGVAPEYTDVFVSPTGATGPGCE